MFYVMEVVSTFKINYVKDAGNIIGNIILFKILYCIIKNIITFTYQFVCSFPLHIFIVKVIIHDSSAKYSKITSSLHIYTNYVSSLYILLGGLRKDQEVKIMK